MYTSLSVYKAQPYSVSSLPTLKVALRILRCVRTHTPSTFKPISAMVYFSCTFICLGQSLCTKGGANSHYNFNYNDQVLHKPPSKWKGFGGVLQCQMAKIEVEFAYKLDRSQKSIMNYFWMFSFFSLFHSHSIFQRV